jgi:L-gulono-1,4-lactone dehydrogenase
VTRAAREDGTAWRNWAGNQGCRPVEVLRPRSEAELVEGVRRAAEAGRTVRAVGSGHSFTPIALSDGTLVDLRHLRRILAIDRRRATVEVEAGITLRALNRELARVGLALENLGDIDEQTLAGAISTGTHGTGLRFGGIATQAIGLRLVTGDGSVLSLRVDEHPALFRAAQVSLGALGVIAAVTLRCVPAYRLHTVEEPRILDEVLEMWPEWLAANDHAELFWVPRTRWAVAKVHRRTDEPAQPRPLARAVRDDLLLDNLAFAALVAIGRRRNELIPAVAKRIPSKGRVEYVDRSDRVLTSPRLVRFVEMEYAVPVGAIPAVLAELRRLVEAQGEYRSFPVEVRAVAGDDVPLSPASGRASGYVALHVAKGERHHRYFGEAERVLWDHGGRPHWGKLHEQDATSLAPRYAGWTEFQAARARCDPYGLFTTPAIFRLLGPPAS